MTYDESMIRAITSEQLAELLQYAVKLLGGDEFLELLPLVLKWDRKRFPSEPRINLGNSDKGEKE